MNAGINFRSWYFPALILCITATLVAAFLVAGQQRIQTVQGQNSARASTLKADIAALPSVSIIEPAKTSGELDYVVATRTALSARITGDLAPRTASWLYTLHPLFKSSELPVQLHSSGLISTASHLNQTSMTLKSLKKLIEYAPGADLPADFSADPVIDERLQRVYDGLAQSAAYLKESSLEHRNQLASAVTELNKRTLALTSDTQTAWSQELLGIQRQVLDDILASDIQQTDYVAGLDAIVDAYQ